MASSWPRLLGVSVEDLREIPLESSRQALGLLFRLSNHFFLAPIEKGVELVLAPCEGSMPDTKLTSVLKALRRQLDSLSEGKITQAEYDKWRTSFDA